MTIADFWSRVISASSVDPECSSDDSWLLLICLNAFSLNLPMVSTHVGNSNRRLDLADQSAIINAMYVLYSNSLEALLGFIAPAFAQLPLYCMGVRYRSPQAVPVQPSRINFVRDVHMLDLGLVFFQRNSRTGVFRGYLASPRVHDTAVELQLFQKPTHSISDLV